MSDEIKSVVCEVIASRTVIGDEIYSMDVGANLLDAGLDSFQLMNVIVELENRFNIVFSDEELILIQFQNIGEICTSLAEVLKKYD